MKKLLLLLSCLFSVSGIAFSQVTATLTGYPLVTTGWTIGGDAVAIDSEVELTGPSESQSGYVYYGTPVNLTTCAEFTVEFDFQIIQSGTSTIADGIAFWYISNPPSGFSVGGGIGLPANPNGLITILDSYNNNGLPDDNPLETLLYYNGTVPAYVEGSATGLLCPVVTYQNFITDGSWHHCKMTYNAGNINVYFNYSTTASLSAFRLISITGYFGFSSSTGLYYSTQNIKNVSITSAGVLSTPVVTSPVTYCQYAAAIPLTATGSPLSWFTSDTATVDSIIGGAPTPNTSVNGTTYYYVRQGTGTCESNPDSIEVIVSPQPLPPVISGDTSYCAGETFVPFTVTGTGILWYNTPTGGTGSSTAPIVNTAVPGTYTYYASQSNSGCESARDSIKVVVKPTPAAPTLTGGDEVYCQYAAFVPFTVTGTGNLWYTVPSGGTGTAVAPVINTSIANTYNYYVSQTVGGCESPRLNIPVTVNAKPAPPALTAPSYCQLDIATPLTATGTAMVWYGPAIPAGGTTTAPTPVTAVPGTYDYYVTQTVLGCVSDSTLDAVTIVPKPAPPVVHDTDYCQYSATAPLTAVGSNLEWYVSPAGGTPLGAAPVPPSTTVGSTTWYVSQTVNGCTSNLDSIHVNIIYIPQYTITPSSLSLCQYDSINIAYTGPALLSPTYNWILPAGAHIVDGTTLSGMPSIVVQFDSVNQSNTVYVNTGNDNGRCTALDSVNIHVIGQPVARPYSQPVVCVGDTVALALASESSSDLSYNWRIDGTFLASSPLVNIVAANTNSGGPFRISWLQSGLHVIQLNAVSPEGCRSAPELDTIDVRPLPNAAFTYATRQGAFCIEDSVQFSAVTSEDNYNYTWKPVEFFHNINKPDCWGIVEQNLTTIMLTVTDPFGCTATTAQDLNPGSCCTVAFPNAFTPGSTINNLFRPIAAGYHNYHDFRITNRWGQMVFESASSNVAWDGTFNGVPQDTGVYFYYIKFDCGGNTVEQKGDVTLIR